MKRIFLICVGAAVCGSAFAGDATSDFSKYMKSMVPKVQRAFETGDLKFFEKSSTDDFTELQGGKTYTKAESMAEMKKSYAMAKTTKCKMKLLSAKASGNTGTAMTYGHMVVTTGPMAPNDKKNHRMVMDMWMTETWVRSGKVWKIKHLEESKPMKMTMDGKPVDPSKMGG